MVAIRSRKLTMDETTVWLTVVETCRARPGERQSVMDIFPCPDMSPERSVATQLLAAGLFEDAGLEVEPVGLYGFLVRAPEAAS